MRLLANENFPGDVVEALRTCGFDVKWVRTEIPGISDQEVLSLAQSEDRILLTFDKDFGELAFHAQLPASSGIILFRITPISTAYICEIALKAFGDRTDWAGHFSVIEEKRIRMTPLPARK